MKLRVIEVLLRMLGLDMRLKRQKVRVKERIDSHIWK